MSKFIATTKGIRKYSPEPGKCYFALSKNYIQTKSDAECLSNFTKIEFKMFHAKYSSFDSNWTAVN